MRVWVARARPGADATAMRLRAMGHEPVVAPVLEVRALPAVLDLDGVEALTFTSANGVRAFAGLEASRRWPVFTVGEATATAARDAGFAAVESADGDVEALGRLIAARGPGLVLHPAATEQAGELSPAGVEVRTVPVYETIAVAPALDLTSVDAVLVHSPKAGREIARMAPRFKAYALSEACAAPLVEVGISVTVADQPNEAVLLGLLAP